MGFSMRAAVTRALGSAAVALVGCIALSADRFDIDAVHVPPAPAPESAAPDSAEPESAELESTASISELTPLPTFASPAMSVCPTPATSDVRCCRQSSSVATGSMRGRHHRCRIGDPHAPIAAMSRVAPPGAALGAIIGAQIANGDAAQLVLYEYDFHLGEPRLNCRGMIQLMQMSRQLSRSPFPLLIQPTLGNPDLDEARRAAVAADLLMFEPALSPDRVIVALPPTRGLDGLDAALIHARVLRLTAGGAPGAGVPAAPSPAAAVPPAR